MSATLYNDWYVSADQYEVGPAYGSLSSEQEHNIDKIYSVFSALGWTDTAIAGMLGNMQYESSLDPACAYPRIGSTLADIGNTRAEQYPDNAYGLVQWKGRGSVDPNNNQLVGYAIRYNREWYDGAIQMARMEWEYNNNQKFHAQSVDGIYYTYSTYSQSTASASVLAKVWMVCYEGTYSQLSNRQSNAENCYLYIHDIPPTPPTPTEGWISGSDFSALAVAYDPDITGQDIPYSTLDCYGFVNKVWHDIPGVSASDKLINPNTGSTGTNSWWRQNISPYPSWTFNTTSPDLQNPTPVLWVKDTINNIVSLYGEIPAGTILFHQISESGPPAIPSQYAGDGIGNFAHCGIYIGNNEVMQSGGRDSSSVPGGGVHRSAYDSSAWNYAAFVVWVDCIGGSEPPEPPMPSIYQWLYMWYATKKKRRLTKNVKRSI